MSLGKEKSSSYLMIRDSFINLFFKAQMTSSFLKLLDSYNFDIVLLPANCTDCLQPLDLSVNKSAKDFLHSQFQDWYAKQVFSPVAGRIGSYLLAYNYSKSKPHLISNGFKEAGNVDCLSST